MVARAGAFGTAPFDPGVTSDEASTVIEKPQSTTTATTTSAAALRDDLDRR